MAFVYLKLETIGIRLESSIFTFLQIESYRPFEPLQVWFSQNEGMHYINCKNILNLRDLKAYCPLLLTFYMPF